MLQRKFANFTARLRAFIDSCQGAPEEAEAHFDELALELFELQLASNEPYRKFCEARGVRPGRVREIPFVPTSAFKEFEFSCLTPAERAHVFYSSGTTEQRPSRHFHNRASLEIYEQSIWPWFARHLLEGQKVDGIRLVLLTPRRTAAPNSSLAYMFHTISERVGSARSIWLGEVKGDGWDLNIDATLRFLQEATDGEPVLVMGTAFNFVQLLDLCSAHQLRCVMPFGSRLLETGGYKGRTRAIPRSELYVMLSNTLGIAEEFIVSEYGMSELSSQAYDAVAGASRADRVFHFPPWARATVIDPETGQASQQGKAGLLRILDLANVFSVAAIETEDLALARGSGFELIGRAVASDPRGCSLMTKAIS